MHYIINELFTSVKPALPLRIDEFKDAPVRDTDGIGNLSLSQPQGFGWRLKFFCDFLAQFRFE